MKLFGREPVAVLALVAYVAGLVAQAALEAADVIEVNGGQITFNVLVGVIAAVAAVLQRARVTPTKEA